MSIATIPEAFVFMKVGNHAKETWQQILDRKNQEYQKAGRIFWGYGGTACHPITQVQPFAKSAIEQNGVIHLLMEPINSKADPEVLPATEYSEDGVIWQPIPRGIQVLGSRYALVLGEITPGDLDIDPREFVVGVGPNRGKSAIDYLQGRVDKACLLRTATEFTGTAEYKGPKKVRYTAKLLNPFAVMLK